MRQEDSAELCVPQLDYKLVTGLVFILSYILLQTKFAGTSEETRTIYSDQAN